MCKKACNACLYAESLGGSQRDFSKLNYAVIPLNHERARRSFVAADRPAGDSWNSLAIDDDFPV